MAGEFIYDRASATPEPYRFTLLNPDSNEEKILKVPPIEWREGTIEVNRNIQLGGIFTSFVVDSLTFIKEGAKFLRDIWDEKEMNGRCLLIVEYYNYHTGVYTEMPSRFSLNFATAKPRVKVGNQSIGFLIEATKSDILVKLENRKSKEIDITKTTTLGGFPLRDYSAAPYNSLKKNIVFPQTNSRLVSGWIGDYSENNGIENDKDNEIFTQFDMQFYSDDIDDCQEVRYETNKLSASSITPFLKNSSEAREVLFTWSFEIDVTNRKGGILNPKNVYAVIYEVYNGSTIKTSERIADVGKNRGDFAFFDSRELNIAVGDSIRVYIKTDDTSNINAHINYSNFKIEQVLATFKSKTLESFPIYEAFERVLQHVSDVQFPFYSDFFGRTDAVYNKNGDMYASENQLRFANVMSGLNIRGAALFIPDNPLPVSFEKIFDSANAIWNIGYEVETIDGDERIRVENYDFFFEDVEILDLSDRIKQYDIEIEAMPELAYSQVKSGFKDYSYEIINGRGEYNTESYRTSVMNTDTVYSIVSDIRGDSMAIMQKIQDELTSEDTEEDNELFILKTQRESDYWKPEKDENITIEEGTSLLGDDSYNLYFTPTRMLFRHGNRIKGAFSKFLATYLRFQKSNKQQTLKTTGEGYTITENDDIQINDLATEIYKPFKLSVTCKFTMEDFELIMTNQKGYVTLSSSLSGYLLSLKKKNDEDRATIELIQKA